MSRLTFSLQCDATVPFAAQAKGMDFEFKKRTRNGARIYTDFVSGTWMEEKQVRGPASVLSCMGAGQACHAVT